MNVIENGLDMADVTIVLRIAWRLVVGFLDHVFTSCLIMYSLVAYREVIEELSLMFSQNAFHRFFPFKF